MTTAHGQERPVENFPQSGPSSLEFQIAHLCVRADYSQKLNLVNNVVAERALVCVAASGERTRFTVRLGIPYYDPRGNWACPVALDGLERPLIDIMGIDSWQALMLARRIAYQLLASRADRGASYIDTVQGDAVDLRQLFDGGP